MTWLEGDWDHRDPDDRLHDVETGVFLEAIGELGCNRLLTQESDMHVHLKEVGGSYRVIKIVKKREPEYIQSGNCYFVHSKDGTRLSLTEEEFDELLEMKKNPEDVYNRDDVEFETLGSEQTAPMDVWDVIFDASDYVKTALRLVEDDEWQMKSKSSKERELALLADGRHPVYPYVRIYSADWFPYTEDKRIKTSRAKQIAKTIKEKDLSRDEMSKLLRNPRKDQRPGRAQWLRKQAKTMAFGPERAQTMKRAMVMEKCWYRTMRAQKTSGELLSFAERKKLWDLWRSQQMRAHGSVELTQWQYERALFAKLTREGENRHDAYTRVKTAAKKHYDSDQIGILEPQVNSYKEQDVEHPEWVYRDKSYSIPEVSGDKPKVKEEQNEKDSPRNVHLSSAPTSSLP